MEETEVRTGCVPFHQETRTSRTRVLHGVIREKMREVFVRGDYEL